MTGHRRTTTSRRKELCTWCCVCVVKCSWPINSSCWTLRRATPMTTWKPRSRESTRSSERARSVAVFVVSSVLSHSPLAHRTMAQDVCVCASLHPMAIAMHAWVECSLTSLTFSSSSLSSSHSSLPSSSSFYPSTSPRLSSKSLVHTRQGDGVYWRVLLQHILGPLLKTQVRKHV